MDETSSQHITEPPLLNLGDWITIGQTSCVVGYIYTGEQREHFGFGVAIFDPSKPTSHDFDWNGKEFFFPERGDFGGYADRQPMYSSFVGQLKRGRYA